MNQVVEPMECEDCGKFFESPQIIVSFTSYVKNEFGTSQGVTNHCPYCDSTHIVYLTPKNITWNSQN